MKATNSQKRKAGLLGLGLDANDGQTRITRGKNFVLYGGSQNAHGSAETAIKVNEKLDRTANGWKMSLRPECVTFSAKTPNSPVSTLGEPHDLPPFGIRSQRGVAFPSRGRSRRHPTRPRWRKCETLAATAG